MLCAPPPAPVSRGNADSHLHKHTTSSPGLLYTCVELGMPVVSVLVMSLCED